MALYEWFYLLTDTYCGGNKLMLLNMMQHCFNMYCTLLCAVCFITDCILV